ncbi:MAG TPA: hydroxymethylbilane synthase, partial [Pyrinomonadaceae bacterium]|nr:hydroxymethylbilane synthase [Pyrinomonadaceae bacterium]
RLALAQAEWARVTLSLSNPALDIHIEIIKTTGDVKTDPLSVIGGKGVFTKELEDALLDQRIDLAVHSLKDLPTIVPEALALAAVSEREDPRDALVLPKNSELRCQSVEDLPVGSIVGTSSPRRLAQLKHLRSDLDIKDLRGNVDTRLRKLDEGQYGAIILASAGLRRLGLADRITTAIATNQMIPAVGQGAMGIETRAGDTQAIALARLLNHELSELACTAERALLRALGGGCQLPIAAHAVALDHELQLDGMVASRDGKQILRDGISGPTVEAEQLGEELAGRLRKSGAADLLA